MVGFGNQPVGKLYNGHADGGSHQGHQGIQGGLAAAGGDGGVAGGMAGKTTQRNAVSASSLPAPQALLGVVPVKLSERAALLRQSFICCWVKLLFLSSIRAIVPEIIGAAMLVPRFWP